VAFYYVEPEVAGELGPSSVVDTTSHPPVVSRLEYRFTDWLGDGIVESFPCYIVTDELAKKLSEANVTGLAFDEVTVTLSPEADELIDQPIPSWKWLKVTGQAFRDDIGVSDDHRLVASDRALDVFRQGGLANADIDEAQ